MAEEKQGWISIGSCIGDYIIESEQSNHKEFKLTHLAYRGMDELGLDFFYQVQSVKLPINSNKTVYLPGNYANYTKVGVFNSVGEVIPLDYNEKLTTYADLQPTRQAQTQDPTLGGLWCNNSPIFYNYWNGYGYVNLFGAPSGNPFVGSFKIDRENGVIVLDENFWYPYICLEYVATPDPSFPCHIPIQFREALISYLRWKDIISMPATSHMNMSDKQYRRTEFYTDRRNARARYKPTYLEQAYEWNLKNQRLTVKS